MAGFIPIPDYLEYPPAEMETRAIAFRRDMQRRHTIRDFSDRPVPRIIIEECIRTAGSAPSGANMQPWHFVAVSSPELKSLIREAAEEEEREFYRERAPQEWLNALEPLGTDANKPFLEYAPWLIAVFAQRYGVHPDGTTFKHYYVQESVGIAVGFLITALHQAGLATLTHTPSPMNFLNYLLQRPAREKPFLLLVAGYPSDNALIPNITKLPLDNIATFL